jgi:hypothetical protein
MIYDLFKYLPDDVVILIWNKLHITQKIFINKEYYLKYYYLIDSIINKGRYDSYIRDIIKNDYIFVFKNIIQNKFKLWSQKINYKYKNIIYYDFIEFIIFYSNKNNSHKCHNLIMLQSGFKKKQRKNNKITYNKWSS